MTDATPDPAPDGVAPPDPGPPGADASSEAPVPGGAAAADAPTVGAAGDPLASVGGDEPVAPQDLSVEALLDDVERLTTERDEYLDRLRRAQADFENSKKRLVREAETRADSVSGRLVEDLLPVLDACDGAMAHGEAGVEPVFAALLQVLEKNGLERIDPAGEVFDPTRHEAVMHEPAGEDDDPALSLVIDVLRIGYAWKGRVVRAAMVKVRG